MMKVPIKVFVFVVLVLLTTEGLTIFRYERLMKSREREMRKWQEVAGGVSSSKKYTASDIIQLIRSSPQWLGDTVTIFDNGDLLSSSGRFQGTINSVLGSKPNMDIVQGQMQTNKLPFQYNVYILAAQYYRQQYAADSLLKANQH
jgi:hypothetical protein